MIELAHRIHKDNISNKMSNNNTTQQKTINSDDEPWTPEEDFPEVFIRLDENNNCIISGPPEKVNELKKQIAQIVMEGSNNVDDEKLKSIKSFEFQVQ